MIGYEDILEVVRGWSAAKRRQLVQELVTTLADELSEEDAKLPRRPGHARRREEREGEAGTVSVLDRARGAGKEPEGEAGTVMDGVLDRARGVGEEREGEARGLRDGTLDRERNAAATSDYSTETDSSSWPVKGLVRGKRQTLERALGLMSSVNAPPSDDEVRRWLDQRRAEKYG